MGLLDKMCDAILGENQSNNDYSSRDNYPYRRNEEPRKVRVTWKGYYKSTDGCVHHAYVDEVIPIDFYRRCSADFTITKSFLHRVIYDCVELETSAPILTVEDYVY